VDAGGREWGGVWGALAGAGSVFHGVRYFFSRVFLEMLSPMKDSAWVIMDLLGGDDTCLLTVFRVNIKPLKCHQMKHLASRVRCYI
jgi:hypothetical protein